MPTGEVENSKRSRIVTNSESVLPSTVAGYRRSRTFILDSLLSAYDYIPSEVAPCGIFQGGELVYRRSDIVPLRSSQSWKTKYSRTSRPGERPIRVIQKDVGGVSRTLELYSESQTEPLPHLVASVENGIPTNDFGNVEVDRIPANAVVIPVPNESIALAMRACKSLRGVPWCKCQTGWKRKSPVFGGIVVLDRDKELVERAIQSVLGEKASKEADETKQATMLLWRQLLRRIAAEWYMQSVVDRVR